MMTVQFTIGGCRLRPEAIRLLEQHNQASGLMMDVRM